MAGKYEEYKELLKRLHRDENATGTVEWMMLITVALTVLVVIYYFVRWAMEGTKEAAEAVEGEYD
ncbi:MAG: hypothetical protein ACYTFY_06330 [Planctomycetota bacterium]|jgi:ABC-type transport system involved in cytochrome c biogenesis permease component